MLKLTLLKTSKKTDWVKAMSPAAQIGQQINLAVKLWPVLCSTSRQACSYNGRLLGRYCLRSNRIKFNWRLDQNGEISSKESSCCKSKQIESALYLNVCVFGCVRVCCTKPLKSISLFTINPLAIVGKLAPRCEHHLHENPSPNKHQHSRSYADHLILTCRPAPLRYRR